MVAFGHGQNRSRIRTFPPLSADKFFSTPSPSRSRLLFRKNTKSWSHRVCTCRWVWCIRCTPTHSITGQKVERCAAIRNPWSLRRIQWNLFGTLDATRNFSSQPNLGGSLAQPRNLSIPSAVVLERCSSFPRIQLLPISLCDLQPCRDCIVDAATFSTRQNIPTNAGVSTFGFWSNSTNKPTACVFATHKPPEL